MSSKKILALILLIAIIYVCFFLPIKVDVYEEVIPLSNHTDTTGLENSGDFDNEENISGDIYDVYITDDKIECKDKDGNIIVYTFLYDRLVSVMKTYKFETRQEARQSEKKYRALTGNGIIDGVVLLESELNVFYDMNYLKEYEECSKSEIEKMLFEDSILIKEE